MTGPNPDQISFINALVAHYRSKLERIKKVVVSTKAHVSPSASPVVLDILLKGESMTAAAESYAATILAEAPKWNAAATSEKIDELVLVIPGLDDLAAEYETIYQKFISE
jgi:hypothetical protein